MTPYHFSRMKGFTLVETLVAITIIMLAVAGPLYTAGRAIVAAGIARDQLTASYLAQEGIEYVRMVRDNQYLARYSTTPGDASTYGWNKFIGTSPIGVGLPSIGSCKTPQSCALYPLDNNPYNSSAPFWQCGTSNSTCEGFPVIIDGPTVFYRAIQATDLTNEEKITSTVTWSSHGVPYTITVTDHLTPWQ